MDELLRVHDLCVDFPVRGGIWGGIQAFVHAVRNVDLLLGRGEILAVVGESGCGKSTLGHALVGLVPWQRGTMDLCGKERNPLRTDTWHDVRSLVQMVFQDPWSSLNPRQTIREILTAPLAKQVSKEQALRKALQAMEQVGLSPDGLDRFPHAFSGGQRQRINIARSLVNEPKVLICDEVTSALDVSVQAQVLQLLAELRRTLGLSIIFITHDLAVVQALADQVIVMYAGQVLERGSVQRVLEHPSHPYSKALLDSVPGLVPGMRPRVLAGEMPSALQTPVGCPFATRCPLVGAICQDTMPNWDPTMEHRCHFPLAT